MIKGWEKQTHDLTEKEVEMIPHIVHGMRNAVGKKNFVTNKRICLGMSKRGYKTTEPRIRKIINYLRRGDFFGDYILIASGNGYYLSCDEKEVAEYIKTMRGRASSILAAVTAIERKVFLNSHR